MRHWTCSPAQYAYPHHPIGASIVPGGMNTRFMRDICAGRPVLISPVGLGVV